MHIAIIGNGISGITAARFIRKLSNYKITVISAETDHFFSRTALMYIYMGHMRFKDTQPYEPYFWKKNKIDLLRTYVEKIDTGNKTLELKGGNKLQFDKLIIATGSKPNKFGWPGQDLGNVGGLYSFQDLEAMEEGSKGLKRAVIVGGGLIGLEMAEMFMSRNIPVTFLVREATYWNIVHPPEEAEMVSRHIYEHGIDLRLSTELKEIVDDGTGKCCAVITNTGERIECGYVGLTAGVSPNIAFAKESGIEIGRGITVNEYLETNVKDIYAIGDCSQHANPRPGRRPIEAIWYTGRMMGETVAHSICGDKTLYDPGIWFNSAKFLDIEYQVYGTIITDAPDNHTSIYWEHASGKKSIRIVYERDEKHIIGFNLMGVRYRHEVCEKWIREKANIEEVLQYLSLANFDPEFFEEYEKEVLAIYKKQSGKNLYLENMRSSNAVISFLKM